MWCEPEFHRAGHGKMFMENKENESLGISAKLVDLEDAEEFLRNQLLGKKKLKLQLVIRNQKNFQWKYMHRRRTKDFR